MAASGFEEEGQLVDGFVMYSNLTYVNEELKVEIEKYAKNYKPTYSKQAGSVYYKNHCQQCGSKTGDFYMHSEPEGAFCPIDKVQGGYVTLYQLLKFEQSISLEGSEGVSSPCYISSYATRAML